jgi:transcriptional regulator with XRE-family HTH domain
MFRLFVKFGVNFYDSWRHNMAQMTYLESFDRWIAQRRKHVGLTQAKAAAQAGMSRVRWAQIESGKHGRPQETTALKMAKVVNGKPERALRLLRFPVERVKRAITARQLPKTRIAQAKADFEELVTAGDDQALLAFGFMTLAHRYHGKDWAKQYKHFEIPLIYYDTLMNIMMLDPLSQYYLARSIIVNLSRAGLLPILARIPQNEDFNHEQQKVLRALADTIVEKQMER